LKFDIIKKEEENNENLKNGIPTSVLNKIVLDLKIPLEGTDE
jgi:hypothetical protein